MSNLEENVRNDRRLKSIHIFTRFFRRSDNHQFLWIFLREVVEESDDLILKFLRTVHQTSLYDNNMLLFTIVKTVGQFES